MYPIIFLYVSNTGIEQCPLIESCSFYGRNDFPTTGQTWNIGPPGNRICQLWTCTCIGNLSLDGYYSDARFLRSMCSILSDRSLSMTRLGLEI